MGRIGISSLLDLSAKIPFFLSGLVDTLQSPIPHKQRTNETNPDEWDQQIKVVFERLHVHPSDYLSLLRVQFGRINGLVDVFPKEIKIALGNIRHIILLNT